MPLFTNVSERTQNVASGMFVSLVNTMLQKESVFV